MNTSRVNALRRQVAFEMTFDDVTATADGRLYFHPDLTTHISGPQWACLYDGMAFALRQGWVMNAHITIDWHRLGVMDDKEASERLEDFGAVLRKRAAKRKWPCAYVYAHERSRDEGLHTHLLTLWPHANRSEFREWAEKYVRGKIACAPLLDSRAIKIRHEHDNDVKRHWLWFGYISKGVAPDLLVPDWHDRFLQHQIADMMPRHLEDSGVVRCRKRVGVSRNIDSSARREAGFKSPFQLGETDKRMLYNTSCYDAYEVEQFARKFVL